MTWCILPGRKVAQWMVTFGDNGLGVSYCAQSGFHRLRDLIRAPSGTRVCEVCAIRMAVDPALRASWNARAPWARKRKYRELLRQAREEGRVLAVVP